MYYNPMASLFLRLLGQAAAASFAEQSRKGADAAQDPFYNGAYGTQVQDDEPIDVEAEVVDDQGKTAKQRAHERWSSEQQKTAGHQLGGDVVFAGSKGYNKAVLALCALCLVAGIALRVYSLVMGQIFSATVVPVALGALGGAVLAFAGGAAIWKIGAWKLPFDGADLALVFFSAALMGYANLPCALIASAIGACYMKATGTKKLPFFALFIVIAIIAKLICGYPGLAV